MANDNTIYSVKFNHDQGCFVCSMESGIGVYNVDPLVEMFHLDISKVGSVAMCELVNRGNLIGMVSGGSRPKFADNHFHMYDNLLKKFIFSIKFPSSVKAIRIRKDKLVVALLNEIQVFSFPTPLQLLHTQQTSKNPRGLLELSPLASAEKQIMIFPGHKTGHIEFVDLACADLPMSKAPITLKAHKGELACLAFNQQATQIASASVQGTLIRIWCVETRTQLLELRRGTDQATITSLNFSANSEFLCCCSDKSTLHIWALKDTDCNKRLMMGKTSFLGDYGGSQWACAKAQLASERRNLCAFLPDDSVIVISADGTMQKFIFNQDGNCLRESFDVFFNLCESDDDDY